jgi:hypothetical protein
MQLARQFWRIIAWSFASAWVAAASFLIVFSLCEGWRLSTRPDLFPIGSERMAQMDLATSTTASAIAFWVFVGILGIGAIFGVFLTIYEWVRYKRFPLLPIDRADVLRNDINNRLPPIENDVNDLKSKITGIDTRLAQIEKDISSLKGKFITRRPRKPKQEVRKPKHSNKTK